MKIDWNDVAMAFLGVIFAVFGMNLLSDALYHDEKPKVAGYPIEGGERQVAAVEEEKTIVDASLMMADVDPAEGQKVAKKCVACHNFGEGEANKVGPVLWDVVNRAIASVPDFGYSGAMKEYGEGKEWTFAELNGFLYKPKDHVPGTSMGFNGVKKDEDRAELLAYLRTLSNDPAPLPDPAAAKPAAADGAAAAGEQTGAEEGVEAPAEEPVREETAAPAAGDTETPAGTEAEAPVAGEEPAPAEAVVPDSVEETMQEAVDNPAATDAPARADTPAATDAPTAPEAAAPVADQQPVAPATEPEQTPAAPAEPAPSDGAALGKDPGVKVIEDTVKIITEPATPTLETPVTDAPATEPATGN